MHAPQWAHANCCKMVELQASYIRQTAAICFQRNLKQSHWLYRGPSVVTVREVHMAGAQLLQHQQAGAAQPVLHGGELQVLHTSVSQWLRRVQPPVAVPLRRRLRQVAARCAALTMPSRYFRVPQHPCCCFLGSQAVSPHDFHAAGSQSLVRRKERQFTAAPSAIVKPICAWMHSCCIIHHPCTLYNPHSTWSHLSQVLICCV